MAGGLVGLFDDIAALAKLAAASIDDVGAAAGRASARELPIIKRIATGSLKNKLLFILPAALLLSEFVPKLVEIILMCGGAFLCYEGAHKIYHKLKGDHHETDTPTVVEGEEAEQEVINGAVRTDFILSAEIMVISLKEVIDEGFWSRTVIMVVVALFITIIVYGIVALIVKMDDVGLSLASRESESSQKLGRGLVSAMPKVLKWLSIIGTAAMLWVGGHILVAGTHELGWDGLYDIVHGAEDAVKDVGGIGGVLSWLVNTALSAVVGLIVGLVIVAIVSRFHGADHAEHAAAH